MNPQKFSQKHRVRKMGDFEPLLVFIFLTPFF